MCFYAIVRKERKSFCCVQSPGDKLPLVFVLCDYNIGRGSGFLTLAINVTILLLKFAKFEELLMFLRGVKYVREMWFEMMLYAKYILKKICPQYL